MDIHMQHVCKTYSDAFQIRDLDLHVGDGQFTTLLGPSGCGKTTILRMIAGLETPDSGEIYFADRCVFSSLKHINVPPEKRNLGFVFQDFALWPHLTVYENVAFPLRARNDSENLDARVRDALETVHLTGYEDRYPGELSGGQQQRVALARAIVGRPDCILFDEPLSALDAILRESMRHEMKRITKALEISAVFVTHDQLEAMSMSDMIVLLQKGKVEQQAAPEEIYQHPRTRFAARFIGKSNWIDDDSMIRPEKLSLDPFPGSRKFSVTVVSVQYLGSAYEMVLDYEGRQWEMTSPVRHGPDEIFPVYADPDAILHFDQVKRSGKL